MRSRSRESGGRGGEEPAEGTAEGSASQGGAGAGASSSWAFEKVAPMRSLARVGGGGGGVSGGGGAMLPSRGLKED